MQRGPEVDHDPGEGTLHVSGEVDGEEMEALLGEFAPAPGERLQVDLSDVTRLPNQAVSAVLRARGAAERRGAEIALVADDESEAAAKLGRLGVARDAPDEA